MHPGKMLCLLGISLVLSAALMGQTQQERMVAVTSALAAKDFDQALTRLQPIIKKYPLDPRLWTMQALALAGKGRSKEALLAYQKALKLSPDFLPAVEGAAQLEYDTGGPDAVPLLKHVLRLRPDDLTSHGMLAVLAYKKGECAQAVEDFDASAPLVDSQPLMREEYGECLIRLNQSDKAISLYQRALELSPEDAVVRRQLADIQLTAKRPKAALETLAPLLQTENPDVKSLELASSAYEADGNTLQAVTSLRQAIVTDPHDIDLYLDFAVLCIDHQSFQVGIDMLNVGLKAESKAAALYVARGVLYVQLARYDEAESDFDRADELEPNQGIGSAAQGLEQAEANDLDRALRTVQSKLASKPNDPYLLYLQADILTQMGQEPGSQNFQTALRSAKKAVALQPTLVPARDVLAKLYMQAGQTQAVIDQCREILKLDPKDQTALYHLIQTLRKTGNTKEIPDLLKRLSDLRVEATKKETEHNRHKLVEVGIPTSQSSQH